jgi:hypothetical protein
MPREVAWERYFNASPDDVKDWAEKARAELTDPFMTLDPVTQAAIKGVNSGNADGTAGA